MKYPPISEVYGASHIQIATWFRFLPSPETPDEIKINDLIIFRLKEFGGITPSISKAIGW